MYALLGASGYLCHSWWASDLKSVILFADNKTAKAWVAKVNKRVLERRGMDYGKLEVQATLIRVHPADLRASINPSVDAHDIDRVMKRAFYRTW